MIKMAKIAGSLFPDFDQFCLTLRSSRYKRQLLRIIPNTFFSHIGAMDSLSPEEELPHLKNEIDVFRGRQRFWPISDMSTLTLRSSRYKRQLLRIIPNTFFSHIGAMDSLSPEEELPHLKNEIGIFRGRQRFDNPKMIPEDPQQATKDPNRPPNDVKSTQGSCPKLP